MTDEPQQSLTRPLPGGGDLTVSAHGSGEGRYFVARVRRELTDGERQMLADLRARSRTNDSWGN